MPEIAIPTPHVAVRSRPHRPDAKLRGLLREATAGDHARLDAQLGALDLCTIAGYRCFLEINAAALLPLEQALVRARVRDLLPDWDARARTDAILGDLVKLGGFLRRFETPELPDRFAVLGTLYVLEGSRLGAAHLIRTVRQAADPLISGNTAFLGHGAGQPLWSSFLAVLERHSGALIDEQEIVAPARRAFDLFAQAAKS